MKIERTKIGNYRITAKGRDISLDEDEFEKLRKEARRLHYETRLLAELESMGYDADSIVEDKALFDEIAGSYADAMGCDDGFDAEGETAYEIISDFGHELENYRTA